jgi:hypothetical protein
MQKRHVVLTLLVLMGGLILSACGAKAGDATPTSTPVDVAAIRTEAAQTVIARITQEAPTITSTPASTNTPRPTWTPMNPTSTNTPVTPTVSLCKNMVYVTDVTIPDGTKLAAGETFTKTWNVQNTGTCDWPTSFKLVFSYGESMSGQPVALTAPVIAGQKVDLSVNLKVPNKTGTLYGYWVLVDENGQHFGSILSVVITVGAASATPTASATATSAPTDTPTQTPSPTP